FFVGGGATVSNLTVDSGASATVFSGGDIGNAVVSSGGSLTISSGGVASGTIDVMSGFAVPLTLLSGATVNSVTEDGRLVFVGSGATVSGLTVDSGASATVFSGGDIGNAVVSSGGSLTISSGGVASGTIDVKSGFAVPLTLLSGATVNSVTEEGGLFFV